MFLGLFLAFFLICNVLSLSAQEYSNTSTTCPEYFNCRNFNGLSFPFFNFSLPGCGFCMLDCEGNPSPKLALDSQPEHWFDVKYIGDSVVKLHDPILQSHLDNQICESFSYNIHPRPSPAISYSILNNITLYRCFITPESHPMITDLFSGYKNYNKCDNVGYTVYYQNSSTLQFNGTIPSVCSAFTLPIVSAYDNSSRDDGLFQLFTSDFDLEWHVSDECYNCHEKGLMCQTHWWEKSGCANVKQGKTNWKLVLGIAASAGAIASLVILAYCFRRKFSFYDFIDLFMSKTQKFQNVEDFLKSYRSLALKRYSYLEVKKMTKSFKIKLGQGGYGTVYKGEFHDGSPIAVKVLKESKGSGEEFINEVASISRTSHVNIVNLLGFCFQGHKRALIYEFMANGSLDKFIYGGKSSTNPQLGLQTLYKISVGIARGLEYLHRGCNTRILHFDIKPHNILLDRDFSPKISDFGLAKLCPSKESIVSMLGTRGTIGYIAPEVFCKNFGGVSHKSDVYSYGMMVFEMVGGRKNINAVVDNTSETYFPDRIYIKIDEGDNLGLDAVTNEEENILARKMIIVSLWCIQTDPSTRPSSTKVVEMLEGSLEALQIPPKPSLSSPSRTFEGSSTINVT